MTLYRVTDGVDGESAYTVVLSSSKGELFKEETVTDITCTVYKGTQTITPNAYEWLIWDDEQNKFVTIENETENTIKIPVSSAIIKQRIKCSVSIDDQ